MSPSRLKYQLIVQDTASDQTRESSRHRELVNVIILLLLIKRDDSKIALFSTSVCDAVGSQAQLTAPVNFELKDKFLIQSMVVDPFYTSIDDISSDLFAKAKDSGNHVEEKKLRVVLLPLQQKKQEEDLSSDSNPIQSLAKNVEELKKEVEELKSMMSVMNSEGVMNISYKESKQLMKKSESKDVLTKTLAFCKNVLLCAPKGYFKIKPHDE